MTDQKPQDEKAKDPKDMQQTGVAPKEKNESEEDIQRKIDEASEESFPASDPPAFTVTSRSSG